MNAASMDVVVLDYGSGNIHSVQRALVRAGARVRVSVDADEAIAADGLVVPGVGAFAACMDGLLGVGGDVIIAERIARGLPVLGICVGQQILFDAGVEHGVRTAGCGLLPGTVEQLAAERLPHMGWNTVQPGAGSRLFADCDNDRFYFVHSYAVRAESIPPGLAAAATLTWATHEGDRFLAAIERGSLSATQFHPEKSADAGARLLWNWLTQLRQH